MEEPRNDLYLDYETLFAQAAILFEGIGFTKEEARQCAEVLLAADLNGTESHGVQRMVRYFYECTEAGMVDLHAKPEVIFETPVSAVIDGHNAMGQLLGIQAMKLAIQKAKEAGIGMVTVRNSNHYGIAGYYADMARKEGLIGISMTNSEAIMVPTFGKQAMLGTNPIAFAMPAAPVPFCFDGATTVVPRGKLEVYAKRDGVIPEGWALDENGQESTDAARVLSNIIGKTGGGILPVGGAGEGTSGYKGYGFGMLCEIFTAILSGGTTSNYIYKTPGSSGICQFFMALDHGIFGDKKAIEDALSKLLQELRDSEKADGQTRIYTQGEKEFESHEQVMKNGVRVNPKTFAELKEIAEKLQVPFLFTRS